LSKEIEAVNVRIRNLLDLAEGGASEGHAIRDRLADLEREKARLTSKLQEREISSDTGWSGELKGKVMEFADNFDRLYEGAPIEERKALIQKCISAIEVDGDASAVRFYVGTVPAITPRLETVFHRVEAENLCVSRECARNRT
jgi:hypothetical protein